MARCSGTSDQAGASRPVWWAAGPVQANPAGHPRPLASREALNRKKANADGDPADRRFREISEDSWSLNKGALAGQPEAHLKE
jgi:hypothetical protein